jgi:hypothetical protein
MAHRFSNSSRIRARIAARKSEPPRWEDIPLEVRWTLLEHIQTLVQEILREVR